MPQINKVKLSKDEFTGLKSVNVYPSTVSVAVDINLNGYDWTVHADWDIVSDLFTVNRVGVFSVDQFCNENGLYVDEFAQKVYNLFKRNYKEVN